MRSQDLFPVTVTAPDGEKITAFSRLVQFTDGTWRLFVRMTDYPEATPTGYTDGIGVLAEFTEVTLKATTVRGLFTLATDTGDYTVRRSGGCGCGNPLKKFRPRG